MNVLKFFGYEKFQNLLKIIKFHGGIKGTALQLVRNDEIKIGTLIGIDKNGNKYYQNDNFFYGRNRWVIYSDKYGYDYDASQVDPEWYGWLHYKTDVIPSKNTGRMKHKWMAKPSENVTGTGEQYVPYSTTKRKIEPWVPTKASK